MTAKEQIVEILKKNKGEYISGEQLAESIGVSRTAVWKAIKKLQDEDFKIEAVTNRGYKLREDNDLLSEAGIVDFLNPNNEIKVEVVDRVVSTNLSMKDRIDEPEGFCLIAKEQTGGVGRFGRKFFSPANTGLYFSILLKPRIDNDEIAMLTSIAALSVCEAIEKLSDKTPQIKWVNDVYVNGKKVSGTLTQASFSMETYAPEYVIVGIGVDLYCPEGGFDESIKDIAGYVFEKQEGDLKNRFVASILNSFFNYYRNFDDKKFVKEYIRRNFVIGKDINVITPQKTIEAHVLDIDDRCRLYVEYQDGTKDYVSSGEISIRLR